MQVMTNLPDLDPLQNLLSLSFIPSPTPTPDPPPASESLPMSLKLGETTVSGVTLRGTDPAVVVVM